METFNLKEEKIAVLRGEIKIIETQFIVPVPLGKIVADRGVK